MGVTEILASVDREIALLQQVRALLGGGPAIAPKKRPGRPKKTVAAAPKSAKKKTRQLSAEGRKRIAEAVKRRWAAQKKATAPAAK